MKEEIKDYLDKKIYGAKKMAIALALCGAATLALTGCGNQAIENSTQIQDNIYRLHTPDGYKDFEVKDIDKYLSSGNHTITYIIEDDYFITFKNSGCGIYDNGDIIYYTTDARMEKINSQINWQSYNENEKVQNPLTYETSPKENSIDLEN